MAHLVVVDGGTATKYLKSTGVGSSADPFVLERFVRVGSGTVEVTGPLTDAELRATPVPVSGTVQTVQSGAWSVTAAVANATIASGTVAATGPLTNAELRATPVPISGTAAVTGPLTNTELRATPVPISGTAAVTGPLTNTELRATPVPVSGTVTTSVGEVSITGGTIAATQEGTWNIGTVTTLPAVTVGGGTAAVTQSGNWNVGGTVTVAGTPTITPAEATLTWATGTLAASGDGTVIAAPGAGTTIVLSAMQVQLEGAAAQTALLKFGTVAQYRALLQNQGDGVSWHFHPGREWEVGDNKALLLNLSGTPSVGYTVAYYTEAV